MLSLHTKTDSSQAYFTSLPDLPVLKVRNVLWFLRSFFFALKKGNGDCCFSSHQGPFIDFYLYANFTVTLPCSLSTFKHSWSGPNMCSFCLTIWNVYTSSRAKVYDVTGVYYLESLRNLRPCSRNLQNLTRQSCQQPDLTWVCPCSEHVVLNRHA